MAIFIVLLLIQMDANTVTFNVRAKRYVKVKRAKCISLLVPIVIQKPQFINYTKLIICDSLLIV